MKIVARVFIILLLATSWQGCRDREELPPSIEGDPVFIFQGALNGDSNAINITAGKDQYFMFTGFSQNVQEVYEFYGEFKRTNCTNCTEALKITLRDDQARATGAAVPVKSVFPPGFYNYNTLVQDSITVMRFSADTTQGGQQNYFWNFGDGTTGTGTTITHAYGFSSTYNVCLTATGSSCGDSICNQVIYDSAGVCNGSPFTYTQQQTTVTFTAPPGGQRYEWDFGDGTIDTTSNIITHVYNSAGTYTVCLDYDAGQGCSSNFCRKILVNQSGCVAGYNYTPEKVPVPDLHSISIDWVDASGVQFLSSFQSQPPTSSFEILNIEDFENNADGEATVKITANIDVVLYELFNPNNTLRLTANNVVFAVAYPR